MDNSKLANTLMGMATELMIQFNRTTALSETLHNQYMERTSVKGRHECSKPVDANAEELAIISNSLGKRVLEIANLLRLLHPAYEVKIPERVKLTYVSTELELTPRS